MVETFVKLELADINRTSYWRALCDQAIGAGYGTQDIVNFVVGVILAGKATGKLDLLAGLSDGLQTGLTTAKDEFIVTAIETIRKSHPADEDNYAIKWASENGHTKIVELLLEDTRASPAAWDSYAIIWASENGHTNVVKLLLNDGRADPAADDSYALKLASKNGHTDVVKLLLNDGRAGPAAGNSYVIIWASMKGHTDVVKLLLDDPRVDPYQIDIQNASAAVKQELERIRDIPRSVLEACSLGPLIITNQLEEDEVRRLRDARNRLELEVVAGHVQCSEIIKALPVPQFGVLFCRARFSPVIMISLLQNCRRADGFIKIPLDDHIFRKFIERRKPGREILDASKDILSMQLTSVNGFDPESIRLPEEIIARIMGLL